MVQCPFDIEQCGLRRMTADHRPVFTGWYSRRRLFFAEHFMNEIRELVDRFKPENIASPRMNAK